ncbi:MAG: hypothetical protein PHD01_13700 [Geobacteraceae bacterium]|nr:hypothetical protein [Geobacteraceae bacterium]
MVAFAPEFKPGPDILQELRICEKELAITIRPPQPETISPTRKVMNFDLVISGEDTMNRVSATLGH